MRIQLMMASAVVALCAAGATAHPRLAARPDYQPQTAPASATTPIPTGTWRSPRDEMALTTDFDKSVWGANATSVRTVELVVRPKATATLRVVKKVVDGKGRDVPASVVIEESELQIGQATPGVADRIEHEVTVARAFRVFPDDAASRWPLEGLKVKLVTFTERGGKTMEIRYDTPEGRGSFWETLTRGR